MGDEGEDVVQINHYAIKVQKARDIAEADAKAVANIIKDWMGANAG
jgi:flagellar M-ring protein FliF